MPTTTITLESTTPETVHQPSAYELWLNAQRTTPKPYQGRHRGRPAVETTREAAAA